MHKQTQTPLLPLNYLIQNPKQKQSKATNNFLTAKLKTRTQALNPESKPSTINPYP